MGSEHKNSRMPHPVRHFRTITHHRHLVCRYCWRLGLIRQGLTHDLSKYSPTEFIPGAIYYQGDKSPNDAERDARGLSLAWLHHKGRNRHHLEYWVDYRREPDGTWVYGGNRMPIRFIAEMFCDRIAASKIYLGENYHDGAPYEYYASHEMSLLVHPDTAAEIEKMLTILRDEGEDAAFAYVRARLRQSEQKPGH